MAHKHTVRDTNAHFTIDQFTRQVKNDSAEKTTIVQYDHNSERLTFEMPLYIDGHAMTLCNLIELHFINISAEGNTQHPGTYEVTDIKAEGDKAIFTWLISQEATQLVGSLNFLIVFKCVEDSKTTYRWSTEIFKNLSVSSGMDNGEAVLTEYPDILAQWKTQLFDASNTAVSNVATAEAKALAAIEEAGEAKKQSVLDSIPDEYEALSALADQSHRNKAGAIVLGAEGESIVVNDASEYPLQNLKLFGKSTQDGTPTPDAPVEIVSVENPVMQICGKNLFNINAIKSYGSVVNNGDNTLTVKNVVSQPISKFKEVCPHLKVGNVATFSIISPATDATNPSADLAFIYLTGAKVSWKNGQARTVTQEMLDGDIYFYASKDANGNGVETVISNLQVELGKVATEYEPYIEAQTVETSHIFHGIPVSSGGNYTDENGQQWICDEVDLARGVYIQRISRLVVDGNAQWHPYNYETTYYGFHIWDWIDEIHSRSPGLCNQFETVGSGSGECVWVGVANKNIYAISKEWYDKGVDAWKAHLNVHPLEIVYARIAPIETPLSEAEINAFKALHSNKPNTTILNDAGAYMAIEYVADTKTYIDNKIAEALKGSEQA